MNKDYLKPVNELEERIKQLQEEKNSLLDNLQTECGHPEELVREAPHHTYKYLDGSLPPFRVCIRCGYAEEGRGCGYVDLLPGVYSDVPEISREKAKTFIRKFYSQNQLSEVRAKRRGDKKLFCKKQAEESQS